jgi:hypothetical protein
MASAARFGSQRDPRYAAAQSPACMFVEGWQLDRERPVRRTHRRVLRKAALRAGRCITVSANGATNSMPSVARLRVFGFFVGQQLQ